PGKTAAADRLAAAGVRPGLEQAATADERHFVFLFQLRAMALRETAGERAAVAAGRSGEVFRQPGRSEPARGTHGLAAERAATGSQPAAGCRRGRAGRTDAGRLRGRSDAIRGDGLRL